MIPQWETLYIGQQKGESVSFQEIAVELKKAVREWNICSFQRTLQNTRFGTIGANKLVKFRDFESLVTEINLK